MGEPNLWACSNCKAKEPLDRFVGRDGEDLTDDGVDDLIDVSCPFCDRDGYVSRVDDDDADDYRELSRLRAEVERLRAELELSRDTLKLTLEERDHARGMNWPLREQVGEMRLRMKELEGSWQIRPHSPGVVELIAPDGREWPVYAREEWVGDGGAHSEMVRAAVKREGVGAFSDRLGVVVCGASGSLEIQVRTTPGLSILDAASRLLAALKEVYQEAGRADA